MNQPAQAPARARYPIIYVRGYAATDDAKDETAADPFCGFNAGSTVYRAVSDRRKPAQRFVFESPVVRLMKDYEYSNIYDNGLDLLDPGYRGIIPSKSIIIYRYYDDTAPLLGGTQAPSMEHFAQGLSQLILQLRKHVCDNPTNCMAPENFRCYLVAHSMGGLICRAFLQNPKLGDEEARKAVDKFFTYATPHNGIDMAGINVPAWLSGWDANTFNRGKLMALFGYDASLQAKGRSDYLRSGIDFDARRCFCMVGTNRADYETFMALSRTFAGHGSDGLVRVENACLCSIDPNSGVESPVATAYAYRSHSGHFGIVNSEEAYQNLTRFLFGDVRVDIYANVESVSLPPAIEGKNVDALYQFEALASPRGKPWFLTRRVAEEDSVACRSHAELTGNDQTRRTLYLSSVFLANRSKVDPNRPTLAYSLTLGARVPDYTVDRVLWLDQHYEGSYLFRDTLIVELLPPTDDHDPWKVRHRWQSVTAAPTGSGYTPLPLVDGKAVLKVDFESTSKPGIKGTLVFNVGAWNDWAT